MQNPHHANAEGVTVPIIPLQKLNLPFFQSVSAGFPSPADDFIERTLDLNEHLITSPSTTFFVRVEGFSMQGAGIYEDDILIVDRSREVRNKDVIIAFVNSEFTVKRYVIQKGKHYLKPENPSFSTIEVSKYDDFQIWGVVISVIHTPYEL
ncbi:MAG: translesion error-prone DNA polymerase V autoproteolytic subunit [Bacteroidota bacterium]